MSLCIRTISNKLTPFVGTRNSITQLDRQLPKHVKETSAFLQEFLAAGLTVNSQTREPVATFNLIIKPLKTSENIIAWNYKLKREGNWNIGKNKRESIDDVAKKFSNNVNIHETGRTIFSIGEMQNAVQLEQKPVQQPDESSEHGDGRPTLEQLNNVYEVLRNDLTEFFAKATDYKIYHPMIVFENNIKGTVTKGIYEYVKQTAMLRIIGHVKFAYVKFDVLKITVHPEDDSIKVRWRIRGLSGYKVLFTFWKFKLWDIKATIDQLDSWYDGFSTFYVDGNGKVTKHVADKVMPDQDTKLSTKEKSDMAAKLALFLGFLTPREFLSDISPLMSCSTKYQKK